MSSDDREYHWARHLDSMEGLPPVTEVADFHERKGPRKYVLFGKFAWLGEMLPGIALALALAACGKGLSVWIGEGWLGFQKSPLSEIMVAILLGLLIRNTLGLPSVYSPGLQLCLKKILRIGIALLGIRLSLMAAGKIGLVGLPVVLGCIVSALFIVSWINNRLGLPRRLGTLIAVGTSICGASAIVATAPVIKAKDDEVSYAVACITLFGMVSMLLYPFCAHWLFDGNAQLAGIFLGTSIHDTAQVAGAGLIYQQQYDAAAALDAATVTKLVRNLFMAVVIPLVAVHYYRGHEKSGVPKQKWHTIVPLFVVGFLVMIVIRTLGDIGDRPFGLLTAGQWEASVDVVKQASKWCLIVAMASIGLGTDLSRMKNIGLKPLMVGLSAAVLVGGVSLGLITLLGSLL